MAKNFSISGFHSKLTRSYINDLQFRIDSVKMNSVPQTKHTWSIYLIELAEFYHSRNVLVQNLRNSYIFALEITGICYLDLQMATGLS